MDTCAVLLCLAHAWTHRHTYTHTLTNRHNSNCKEAGSKRSLQRIKFIAGVVNYRRPDIVSIESRSDTTMASPSEHERPIRMDVACNLDGLVPLPPPTWDSPKGVASLRVLNQHSTSSTSLGMSTSSFRRYDSNDNDVDNDVNDDTNDIDNPYNVPDHDGIGLENNTTTTNDVKESGKENITIRPKHISVSLSKPAPNFPIGLTLENCRPEGRKNSKNNRVAVKSIDPTGLFAQCPILPGDVIANVNGVDCKKGMDAASVMILMDSASQFLTIVIQNGTPVEQAKMVAKMMAKKKKRKKKSRFFGQPKSLSESVAPLSRRKLQEPDEKLVMNNVQWTHVVKPFRDFRLGIRMSGGNGDIRVLSIDETSLLQHSLMQVGDQVLSVNSVDCQDSNVTVPEVTVLIRTQEGSVRFVTSI